MRRKAFVKADGSALGGAPVTVLFRNRAARVAGVELLEDRRPYGKGEVFNVPEEELWEALEPEDRVTYSGSYLAACEGLTKVDRTGTVVRSLEGTLVELKWDDGLGPRTMSTFQLCRILDDGV